MASVKTPAIEDAITLVGLAVFKSESDQHYAGKSKATATSDGLMSSTDKAKLDGIATMTDSQISDAVAAAFE